MVRVKYRYIVSLLSVGSDLPDTRVGNTSGYPGCILLTNSSGGFSDDSLIYRAIKACVKNEHGSFGLGRIMARFRIIYWNPYSGLLIVRVLRGLPTEQLTSAMTLLTSIQCGSTTRPALIDVLHRSGTVRGCQKFLIAFYQQQIFSCVSGVQETAIARAITRKLIDANPPVISLELS